MGSRVGPAVIRTFMAQIVGSSISTCKSRGLTADLLDPGKKRARLPVTGAGHIPGDDLLSQDLSSHYHWRCSVSLPGSEWDRVVPPRCGHQRAISASVRLVQGGSDLELGLWRPQGEGVISEW